MFRSLDPKVCAVGSRRSDQKSFCNYFPRTRLQCEVRRALGQPDTGLIRVLPRSFRQTRLPQPDDPARHLFTILFISLSKLTA